MEPEVQNPALLHHFADAEQQKNAASLGMWLFLVTEIMFFGGMFCAYLVYRLAHFNAFAAGSQQLSIKLGALNTAVLIVSSLTVVLAVKAAEAGRRKVLVSCRTNSRSPMSIASPPSPDKVITWRFG
jgi:cytochrome c oxidase subunit III